MINVNISLNQLHMNVYYINFLILKIVNTLSIKIKANQIKQMNIFVKTQTGKTLILHVEQTDTIENVKAKITQQLGIPICQQRLITQGKLLENEIKLSDYKIEPDITFILIIQLDKSRFQLKKQYNLKYFQFELIFLKIQNRKVIMIFQLQHLQQIFFVSKKKFVYYICL
ncbi:Ubiquitin-60S ribosomal protein L40 [Paramecium bursaria]